MSESNQMTFEEAKAIYFRNFGSCFRMDREESPACSLAFRKLNLSPAVLREWDGELFSRYFPEMDKLPLGLTLGRLMGLAPDFERQCAVADFFLKRGEGDPAFWALNVNDVLLGQNTEFNVGDYYGIVSEAVKAKQPEKAKYYARYFADYAFAVRERNYTGLDVLVSFDVTRRAGLSQLYLGKETAFDRENYLQERRRGSLSVYFDLLSGFATGLGPSKTEAAAYLDELLRKKIVFLTPEAKTLLKGLAD